jgi:hypothetical protein
MTYSDKLIWLIALFGFILSSESCIEPIVPPLNENDSESLLVVEGNITNEAGPFKVKLTTSIPVNNNFNAKPVSDADIRIRDDKGNEFQLKEEANGWYETEEKDLKGISGNSYSLYITTKEGVQYLSSPVRMEEVPEIDSIYFDEVTKPRFEDGQAYEDNWLNILMDTHDPVGKTKYWRFEYEETWEVKMLTDNVMVEHSPPGDLNDITWERITINEDKRICWVTMPSSSVHVASTSNSQVDEIKRFPIQSIGPNDDKLHIRYSILVKQSSISHELYDYWKQLMDANENVGGIYDKIPAPVFGNMSCSNGNVKVLGYFSASSVKKKRIFIDKMQHHIQTISAYKGCNYFDFEQLPWIPKSYFGTIAGTDTKVYCSSDFCSDCKYYGTNEKPDFWK